ncbi:MAG TPA: hypothetical protein VL614_23990 [Acetobacteraceae bacterium]|jgi:hypothetical protein|nr:hypothetical protein [Acetobacteraceae bacterium]
MLLRWLALLVAFLACLAPMAHLLEMPNKLRLDGPLWLAVQQHLYNGWGPFIGAPTEIGGLLISLILLAASRGRARMLVGLAAAAYGGMLLSFFLLNAPVNAAVNGWTPATLPVDWAGYRWRWEIGHALSAVFALLGLAATGAAVLRGRPPTESAMC